MFFKYIPFTYHWIVRRAVGANVKTILDLGCGEGDFMKDLSENGNWDITGVELHSESAQKAKQSGIYKAVVRGDVTNLPRDVLNRKYDVVFSSQTLEHLKKSDGRKALEAWEKLAKKRIVVTTPVGFIEYEPIEEKKENNPLQKHLSGWSIKEMKALGFAVYGQGARFIYGKKGLARKFSGILPLWFVISYIASPFVYFFPEYATYMIAVKNLND